MSTPSHAAFLLHQPAVWVLEWAALDAKVAELDGILRSKMPSGPSTASSADNSDIYISYCRGTQVDGLTDNHERVSELNAALQARGWHTELGGEAGTSDAPPARRGVERARAVLVCLSQKYIAKVSDGTTEDACRRDFTAAINLQGAAEMIVPVVMEAFGSRAVPTTGAAPTKLSMVTVVINNAPTKLRVDACTPDGGREQWGVLLESMGSNLSKDDAQKVLAAFCNGRPLMLLSTRFKEPSFQAAQRVKGEVESGARGAAGPCFNPNEDNVNYQDNYQKVRNDRWLRVWQHMARQAKTSRGKVIQLLDEDLGLSEMQKAEAEFSDDIGLRLEQEPLTAAPRAATAASLGPSGSAAAPTESTALDQLLREALDEFSDDES